MMGSSWQLIFVTQPGAVCGLETFSYRAMPKPQQAAERPMKVFRLKPGDFPFYVLLGLGKVNTLRFLIVVGDHISVRVSQISQH